MQALLRRPDVHELTERAGEKAPAGGDVIDQGLRLVLSEYADAAHTRVHAVGQSEVNVAEVRGKRHCRLALPAGQLAQTCPIAAGEYESQRLLPHPLMRRMRHTHWPRERAGQTRSPDGWRKIHTRYHWCAAAHLRSTKLTTSRALLSEPGRAGGRRALLARAVEGRSGLARAARCAGQPLLEKRRRARGTRSSTRTDAGRCGRWRAAVVRRSIRPRPVSNAAGRIPVPPTRRSGGSPSRR